MSWSTGGTSVYDSIAGGSASSIMENLQAQLKQKEGDILQRQVGFDRMVWCMGKRERVLDQDYVMVYWWHISV